MALPDISQTAATQIMAFRMGNNPQYIETVLNAIGSIARIYAMPEKEITKLCMATEEAIANVMKYGFSPDEIAFFDIEISIFCMDFIVTIFDKGKPYDFSSLELVDGSWEGIGIKMMKGLTDKVEFNNLGFEGRSQSLIKHLVELPLYQKSEHEEVHDLPEHIEFDFHQLREKEAIEVAQCIYDEFGYSYLSETVYYPQQFYEACLQGNIYSLVATTPQGEVAGHLALTSSKEFPGTAEMGIGVVKRKYRKFSIMKELTDMIIHHARHVLKLNGLFAQPVAYHTITQKLCNYHNLTPCSIALHYTNEFATSFYDGKSRSNICCAMLPFADELQNIYLPEEVVPMISEVIQNMKINRQILDGNHPGSSIKTVASLSINHRMCLGKCLIEKVGVDLIKEIKTILLNVKREKCTITLLYINLSDSAAPYAYQLAKKFNFFCIGLMPQSTKGDYLIMECLMNDIVDYESIKTVEPFTNLLEHIRKLDPNET